MPYQVEVEKTYKAVITILSDTEKDAVKQAVYTSLSQGITKDALCSVKAKILEEGTRLG